MRIVVWTAPMSVPARYYVSGLIKEEGKDEHLLGLVVDGPPQGSQKRAIGEEGMKAEGVLARTPCLVCACEVGVYVPN